MGRETAAQPPEPSGFAAGESVLHPTGRRTMNLQTFKAATMAEALTQVKSNMGADAVILHTRTFYTRHWLGLRRREMVEITAGKGLNVGRRKFVAEAAPSAQPTRIAAGSGGIAAYRPLGGGRTTLSRGDGDALRGGPDGGRALLESPAGTSAAMLSISKEVSDLKSLVKD